jgi:hypothetical protein
VTYYVVIAFDRGAEGDLKPGEAAASFPRRRSLIKDFASDSTNGSYLAKSANMMRRAVNKPTPRALGIFSPLR